MDENELIQEFDKQVENLIQKGYSKAFGKTNEEFIALLTPLKNIVQTLVVSHIDLHTGYLPFVIVIKNEVVPTHIAMSLVEKDGKQGITKLYPHEPKDFQVIDQENIPDGFAYVIVDVDRGKESINLTPSEALKDITLAHRHPLTIDEGLAIITHYPEFLMKNNCFSLLASRHVGDKRVPAIWINSKKQPNLGWCWEGNPHTWLGSASCGKREGF